VNILELFEDINLE